MWCTAALGCKQWPCRSRLLDPPHVPSRLLLFLFCRSPCNWGLGASPAGAADTDFFVLNLSSLSNLKGELPHLSRTAAPSPLPSQVRVRGGRQGQQRTACAPRSGRAAPTQTAALTSTLATTPRARAAQGFRGAAPGPTVQRKVALFRSSMMDPRYTSLAEPELPLAAFQTSMADPPLRRPGK